MANLSTETKKKFDRLLIRLKNNFQSMNWIFFWIHVFASFDVCLFFPLKFLTF